MFCMLAMALYLPDIYAITDAEYYTLDPGHQTDVTQATPSDCRQTVDDRLSRCIVFRAWRRTNLAM